MKPDQITFNELFKATLSMIALTGRHEEVPRAEYIQAVFNQVLKACDLCFKDFEKIPPEPSVYKKEGVKTL